jgi:hypothetical protein
VRGERLPPHPHPHPRRIDALASCLTNGHDDISFSLAQGEFEQESLDAHNKYRAIHNVAVMSLNKDMNAQAAKWAQYLTSLGKMKHADIKERNGNGENIYYSCGLAVTGGDVTTAWLVKGEPLHPRSST